MIRRLQMAVLRFRVFMLEAQIANGEALLHDHQQRLATCYDELRRVKSRLGTITPAHMMIDEIRSRA